MKRFSVVFCIALGLSVLASVVTWVRQEPKHPFALLDESERKQRDRIAQEVDELRVKGECAHGIVLIDELLSIHRGAGQKDDWWEIQDLLREKRTLKELSILSLSEREEAGRVVQLKAGIPEKFGSGQNKEALRDARSAVEAGRRLLGEEHQEVLQARCLLAVALRRTGQVAEAHREFRETLDLQRASLGEFHPDPMSVASNLALLLRKNGDYRRAQALYEEALEGSLMSLGVDHEDTRVTRSNYARVLEKVGDRAGAESEYERLLESAGKGVGNVSRSTLLAKGNLIELLGERGKWGTGLPEEFFEECSNVHGVGSRQAFDAEVLLCRDLVGQKQFEDAHLRASDLVSRMAMKLGSTDDLLIRAETCEARALMLGGRLKEARERYLSIHEKVVGAVGEKSERALSSLRPIARCEHRIALNTKVTKDRLAAFEAAITRHRRLVRLTESGLGPVHRMTFFAKRDLASCLIEIGDFDEANEVCSAAAEAIESLRAGSNGDALYRAEQARTYEVSNFYGSWALVLSRMGQVERAFEVAELGKSRAMLDLMAASDLDLMRLAESRLSGGELQELRSVLTSISKAQGEAKGRRSQLLGLEEHVPDETTRAEYRRRLRSKLQSLDRQLKSLRFKKVRFLDAVVPVATPASLKEIRGALGPQEVLLYYSWSTDGVMAFLVPSEGAGEILVEEVAVRAAGWRKLVGQLKRLQRQLWGAEDWGNDEVPNVIPEGFESTLATKEIVVVPGSEMANVPFRVLLGDLSCEGITMVDSGSLLAFLRQRKSSAMDKKKALLVGDPSFPDGEGEFVLHGLPHTAEELSSVRGKLEAADFEVEVLTGEHATRAEVLPAVQGASVVHFATHGFTGRRGRPGSAFLALAGSTPEESMLELSELFENWQERLNRCELVVLSTCSSGRGVRSGTSVFSMASGFLFAGAQAVVAAQWPVDDRATKVFMTRFYENLSGQHDEARSAGSREFPKGSGMSAKQALWETQTWMKGSGERSVLSDARGGRSSWRPRATVDYSHPRFWAGFVLIGG